MRNYFLSTYFTLLFSGVLLFFAGGSPAAYGAVGKYTPDTEILAEFDALQLYIGNLSNAELKKGLKNSLSKQLNAAEAAYQRGKGCTAVNILGAYLNHSAAIMKGQKGKYAAVAEDLRNRGTILQNNVLLNISESMQCRGFEDFNQEPAIHIAASDNTRFDAAVSFGLPFLTSETGDGETWTKMHIPGLQSEAGEVGLPAVPAWNTLVAVPQGASVHVKTLPPVIRNEILVNLYPFQDEVADHVDLKYFKPPFAKDQKVYQTNAFFPAEPCTIALIGNIRGLNIAQLTCTSAQYNPVSKVLRLYDEVDFEVTFDGGDGAFITSRNLSPFEPTSESSKESVINKAVIQKYVLPVDISHLTVYGEELLILTHPDFRDAADDLAQWKEDKGIITSVFEVGQGTPYDTGAKIDDLIEYRYENCAVRPSYVLLLGDSEFVPPARTDYDSDPTCSTCGDSTTGSDYGYAMYPEFFFDILPDFGVGRIPVDTLAEAQTVVDKIINYESDPPFIDWFDGAPYYTTAANAAEFQGYLMNADGSPFGGLDGRAQRSFTEVSEFVRAHMMLWGHTVERIYDATEDTGGYCLDEEDPCTIQQPYTGIATPNRYRNGTLLPTDIRASSGYAWDGDTDAVVDAFNEGRFLILHRDHGASNGWGTPSFRTWDFGDLSNDELLPVVYSVNCSSGFWDRETDHGSSSESFMELLLMEEDGGMVSGLGDNRNSPTWANSALTRGFYDATWPTVAPEFGDNERIYRLGDILNHGKVYLLSQVGVAQTAGSISLEKTLGEFVMWHVYGDPTLEMWTKNPYKMILGLDHWAYLGYEHLEVGYAVNGAVITAYQITKEGTVPIGRAVVEEEVAEIPFFRAPVEGIPIMLSASYKNAVSVLLTPPEASPDLRINQLINTPAGVATMFHPGEDISSRLAIEVENLGQGNAPGTIMVNPDGSISTQDGYMIDLMLSTDEIVPMGWASPPSTIFSEDALLQGGRVSRTPDVAGGSTLLLSTAPPVMSDIGGIIPSQIQTGSYFLCGRIDPGEMVEETDESNNVTCMEVQVQPMIMKGIAQKQ
ncbi:C25 family cysteine peptidase [Desulfogranum japonicum]|uniref:C25 family cysteine peptidase n=1 Tax=Desulfogranum japonicum TaxID=231447 RepID=UPI000400DF83|nr:C25 family cysteine peptidase [Desulfogranum japonicum]